MLSGLYIQSVKVFLANVADKLQNLRSDVKTILMYAGFDVVDPSDLVESDVESNILLTDCSVHLLGNENIIDNNSDIYDTPSAIQYRTAKSISKDGFRVFLWNPEGIINDDNFYINDIRRDINDNTIYMDMSSAIVFVEELRSIMNVRPMVKTNVKSSDMLFIYNSLDRTSAKDVVNMLSDLHTISELEISNDSTIDYTSFIQNQLPLSSLGIIYYDFALDWAPSFAQQVWKQMGGQSSSTPLFIVGNSNHANEQQIKSLKKIIPFTINEMSIIPLDIKIFYDKIVQQSS